MKIVILDGYTLNPGDLSWEGLEKLGDLTVFDRTINDPEKVIAAIADAEIVFTNKTLLPKEVLENVPTVKYIGVLATGCNIVDIATVNKMGITLTNVPAYSTNAVAQFTFALLLELTNQIGVHNAAVQDGEWVNSIDFSFTKTPLMELHEKTFGIIGYGNIGQAVAKIAIAFGMKLQVFSNKKYPELESENFKNVTLEELLSKSDIISLHCPLTEKTKGIINRNSIEKMKNSVMIINTSRGPLIVEEDLKNALNAGRVRGAAVDVVSEEPIKKDNHLLQAKNLVMTPHIAWAPKEARERLMQIAVSNLDAFLQGNPVNVIKG